MNKNCYYGLCLFFSLVFLSIPALGQSPVEIIEDEGLVERASESGQYAINRLQESLKDCPIVGDIRGRGVLFGVEIVESRELKTAGNDLAEKIYYRCLDQGLSFKISQGCVLTLSPPMNISREDLDAALSTVEAVILQTAAK